MQQKTIDIEKLKAIFDECAEPEMVQNFARIKNVYDTIFSTNNSSSIDFSTFTVDDIHDTLDDLSDFQTPDNYVDPDNTGVVLGNLDAGERTMRHLCAIPPAKLHLEFF